MKSKIGILQAFVPQSKMETIVVRTCTIAHLEMAGLRYFKTHGIPNETGHWAVVTSTRA